MYICRYIEYRIQKKSSLKFDKSVTFRNTDFKGYRTPITIENLVTIREHKFLTDATG